MCPICGSEIELFQEDENERGEELYKYVCPNCNWVDPKLPPLTMSELERIEAGG